MVCVCIEWIYDPDGPNPKMEVIFVPYSATYKVLPYTHP